MDVAIHNQYPDIELVLPVYFCNCGTCYEYPVERTDASAIMKFEFRFDLDQNEPEGILMYGVREKRNTKSDRQSSTDTTSVNIIKETSKTTQLLVAWKIRRSEEPKVRIALVEYDHELVLNETSLRLLYNRIVGQLSRHYNTTWSVSANVALVTTYEATYKNDHGLKITISEGFRYWGTRSALWIDSTRQVLSVIVIYFC
jgi:hypothetical protein